jgi:peptide chain release factor subunit 1
VDNLASKEGRGTELVSLYVPPGRQISDVLAMLKQEYGTATNIKSDTTRKNVQDAITRVSQRIKLFKKVPENGLVFFSGVITQNGVGSEKLEIYVITPPEPIHIYLYRCDARFHTEHLRDLLKEKKTYGILVIDSSATTYATLQGSRLEIVQEITSGIPGKHRAGGQSAARFQRLREAKVQDYFKRVGKHANDLFMQIPDLESIIIGGPGPTKQDFEKENYLHYTLKEKIIATIDTAYVGNQGVKEIMKQSPELLRRVRYIEEKRIMQKFLYEIAHDTGLATYGENEVRQSLKMGAVKTLLLSEDLDVVRVTLRCNACEYSKQETMKQQTLLNYEKNTNVQSCPKCTESTIYVAEVKDLIESLVELAEQSRSDVEIISTETEEGVMLKDSFGSIAAILRFKSANQYQ